MSALPEGFYIARRWAADVALEDVRAAIAWEQRTFTMYGRTVQTPRLTAWYGDGAYTYSRQRHEPAPMPAIVAELRARLLKLTPIPFNSCLANLYRDGADSVAWHADDEPELGAEPLIASVSLGAGRDFHVRETATRKIVARIYLEHGDLLVMRGRSQADYQHAIPKVRGATGLRVNLTFRRVAVG